MSGELQLPSEKPKGWKQTPEDGLNAELLEGRKRNTPPRDDGKSTLRIILENVLTLFNALNLVLALALIWVGSYRNMLFMMVVICNTGISILQEIRARNTIRKLKLLNAPKAHVIREGREITVSSEEVAEGDLLLVRGGDQIVADCTAISGGGRAMESLLTGESDDIPKRAGDWLYSGSYMTEGRILCQAVYVGEESYAGRLTQEARKHRKHESGLMKELNRLIRWDIMALIPMGALLMIKQMVWQKLPVETAVPAAVASMIGMIPEGLILLTSMAMAAGVLRLGNRQVLVQELYGIESLARVDTLCLDKTGTLTTGRMTLEEVLPAEAEEEEARCSLRRFLGAFDEKSGTLDALRNAVGVGMEEPVAIQPFSSRRKKSAASFANGKTLILGAPDYVLEDAAQRAEILKPVNSATREGKRALVLAEADGIIEGESLPDVNRVLAVLTLADEVRPHTVETVNYFRQEGVTLKVISGDDPETVSRIARQSGMDSAENAVDARSLTTKAALLNACERYTVFGRVTPEQKKALVEALKERGHTVAMTGDGVNDIPALRIADCSIAMAEGADAARHAAQITLLESDFAAVPEIVLEGRRVINNITRSATLFLTKTIFSFLLTLLALAVPGTVYPFQPIQLSLISACTVGIPGFILAMEMSRERIQGSFLKNVIRKALPGGVSVAACATVCMLMVKAGWNTELCSTLAAWCAGLIGILVLARISWPFDLIRACVSGGALVIFVLCATLLEKVFALSVLWGAEWIYLAGIIALGVGIYVAVLWAEGQLRKRRNQGTEEASERSG